VANKPVSAPAPVPAAKAAPPPPAPAPKAEKPPAEKAEAKAAAKEGEGKSADSSSVRVETAKLDHLLDMVGEMVIAQSLIRHNPVMVATMDARLLADIAQLSRNTAEVQRTTMAMRMIPIGQLFQRTARLIRDLSRKAGKQISLETVGEDTEVDKTIAEELSDPLLHMVRNSVDHGVELPAERAATGKDPNARIRLKAYHQAGQIVIEISDDGRGLNKDKIIAKAMANGLITSATQLSDSEIYQLIFEPGFSTADKITDVSGRGVGMDVVKRNVQKLRGKIDTQSTPGHGTTFLLKFPLTLAIIEGLVVMVGNSRYIVPIFSVREMFRPTPGVLSTVQEKHEMALVRGNLLPIVRLHRRFNIPSKAVDPSDGLLVVAECDGKQFCLLVDDLVGKQEVVIKSLGETFKDVTGLAGCAILGDGRVGLILDMEGIYHGGVQ
jgi:two-component system chemotaxis sensor kinase CheA